MEQGLSPNQPYQGAARHLGCPLLQYPFLPLCSQERQRNWGETGRQETQGNPTPGWVTAPRFLDLSYPICKMNQLQRQNTSRGPAWSDDSRGLQAGDSLPPYRGGQDAVPSAPWGCTHRAFSLGEGLILGLLCLPALLLQAPRQEGVGKRGGRSKQGQ